MLGKGCFTKIGSLTLAATLTPIPPLDDEVSVCPESLQSSFPWFGIRIKRFGTWNMSTQQPLETVFPTMCREPEKNEDRQREEQR